MHIMRIYEHLLRLYASVNGQKLLPGWRGSTQSYHQPLREPLAQWMDGTQHLHLKLSHDEWSQLWPWPFSTRSLSKIPFLDCLLVCLPFCLFSPMTHFQSFMFFVPVPCSSFIFSFCWYFIFACIFLTIATTCQPCFAKIVKFELKKKLHLTSNKPKLNFSKLLPWTSQIACGSWVSTHKKIIKPGVLRWCRRKSTQGPF